MFEHVRQQKAKKYENHPIGEYKTTFRKTCILRVFEIPRYKKGKTNGNTNNINNKTIILGVFDLATHKKSKMYEKYYV